MHYNTLNQKKDTKNTIKFRVINIYEGEYVKRPLTSVLEHKFCCRQY